MIRLEVQVSTFSLVHFVTVLVSITTAVLCYYVGIALYGGVLRILSILTGTLLIMQSAGLLSTALLMINNRRTLLLANGMPFLGTAVTGIVWFCLRITLHKTQSPTIEIASLAFWVLTEMIIGMSLVFSVMKFRLLDLEENRRQCLGSHTNYTHSQNSSLGDSTMFEHTSYHKNSASGNVSFANSMEDALFKPTTGVSPIKNKFNTPKLQTLKSSFKAHHQSDSSLSYPEETKLQHSQTASSLKLYQLMNDQSSSLLPLPVSAGPKPGVDHTSSPNSTLSKFTKLFNTGSNNTSNKNPTNSSPQLLYPQPQAALKPPSPQEFDNWDINTSIHSKLFLPPTPYTVSPGTGMEVRSNHPANSYFPAVDDSSFISSSSNQFNSLLNHAGFARNHTPNPAALTNAIHEDELEYENEYTSPYYSQPLIYSPHSDDSNDSSDDQLLLLPTFSFAGTEDKLRRLSLSGSDTSDSIFSSPVEQLSFGQYDKEKSIREIPYNTALSTLEAA